MSLLSPQIRIDSLSSLCSLPLTADVLRLDLLHPVVSGNKWFKLKEYITAAQREGKTALLTFGGAYSNHLLATAAAAQMHGLKSIGIVRGEEAGAPSYTLLAAKAYGMRLYFVSRAVYRGKTVPPQVYEDQEAEKIYTVSEGGYGALGAKGAMDILLRNNTSAYTHIVTAVGTGTTLAGLAAAALPHQKVIGIPVLKNAASLQPEIDGLLPPERHKGFELIPDYHFGGYAKYNDALLRFMNDFYHRTKIATDFVYTGKAFYAAFDLLAKKYFSPDGKILLVHTGGLQGNGSLKKEALIF